MLTFKAKRYISISLTLLIIISLVFYWCYSVDNLIEYHIKTGFILFAIIVFLILLNIRKMFPFLPLGKVSTWLRLHVYSAYIGIVLFFIHTDFALPNGLFESILYWLFVIVNLSGIFGLWVSRVAPEKMTDAGGSIIYEAIPQALKDYRDQAESLVLSSIDTSGQTTLSNFYLVRLKNIFSRPRFSSSLLYNSRHAFNDLKDQIDRVRRYCNADEEQTLIELHEICKQKLELDTQYSFLIILKYWLFIHVPLSYVLFMLGIYHGYLAKGFVG